MLEKKSARMLLRLTDDMSRQIRALAEIHNRALQDQLRHLLMIGLKHSSSNDSLSEVSQLPSTTKELFAPPSSAVNSAQVLATKKRGAA